MIKYFCDYCKKEDDNPITLDFPANVYYSGSISHFCDYGCLLRYMKSNSGLDLEKLLLRDYPKDNKNG